MQWLNNPFVFPILIAGLISIVNALIVAQRRRVTGSTPLFGMLLAISWWSFTYIFELASAQQGWELIWSKLEYIGIVNVPVLFLLFSLEYSGYHSKVRRWYLWLWVVPLLTLILVWTNDYTGLIWSHIGQVMVGGYYLLAHRARLCILDLVGLFLSLPGGKYDRPDWARHAELSRVQTSSRYHRLGA